MSFLAFINQNLIFYKLQGYEINLIIKVSINFTSFLIQKSSLLNLGVKSILLIACVHILDNVLYVAKENIWTLVFLNAKKTQNVFSLHRAGLLMISVLLISRGVSVF